MDQYINDQMISIDNGERAGMRTAKKPEVQGLPRPAGGGGGGGVAG